MDEDAPKLDKQAFLDWLRKQPKVIDMYPDDGLSSIAGSYVCRCVVAQYLRHETGHLWTTTSQDVRRVSADGTYTSKHHRVPDWVSEVVTFVDCTQWGYKIERDKVVRFVERL